MQLHVCLLYTQVLFSSSIWVTRTFCKTYEEGCRIGQINCCGHNISNSKTCLKNSWNYTNKASNHSSTSFIYPQHKHSTTSLFFLLKLLKLYLSMLSFFSLQNLSVCYLPSCRQNLFTYSSIFFKHLDFLT